MVRVSSLVTARREQKASAKGRSIAFSIVGQVAIAIVAIAAAAWFGRLLDPYLGRESPFLLSMAAIIVVAYAAGFGIAAAATVASTVLLGRTLFQHSIHPTLIDELVPLAIFCVIGLSTSWFVVTRRRAVDDLLRSNRLLQELYHGEHEARIAMDKLAEDLRQSELRYRKVANLTQDALWDWRIPQNQMEWSDGMTRVFGYKPKDVSTDPRWWQNRFHADDRDRVLGSLAKAIHGDAKVWTAALQFRRAEGDYANVVCRASILRDESGQPVRMIGSMMDMTELKQAERALRESQRFLLRLLKSVPSPVVLLDSKGRIVLFNRACEEISGYRRREVLGKTIPQALLAHEDVPHFERRMADPYAPEVCVLHESHWRTKTGEMRLIEWRFTPVPSPDGQLHTPYLLGAGTDITERRGAMAC